MTPSFSPVFEEKCQGLPYHVFYICSSAGLKWRRCSSFTHWHDDDDGFFFIIPNAHTLNLDWMDSDLNKLILISCDGNANSWVSHPRISQTRVQD